MSLRLLEIYYANDRADRLESLLKDLPVVEEWHVHQPGGGSVTKILLRTEDTEQVLSVLERCCHGDNPPRIVILPVEATLPRLPEPPADEQLHEEPKSPGRISTEELYQKLSAVAVLSRKYIIMTSLASFVAAVGLLKNDVAVIIGSMVIAPLLNPNMALALATALADRELGKKAITATISGIAIAVITGTATGMLIPVDPEIPQIATRSDVSQFYVFLALATGIAGAYSVTTGVAEALVGVMVAVAILPPLVATGLLFGSGYWHEGVGSGLLFLVNIVSINLTGVITFVLQGLKPKNWWEAGRARKAVRVAVGIWITLLIFLTVIIILGKRI